jgi:hypothetical protein
MLKPQSLRGSLVLALAAAIAACTESAPSPASPDDEPAFAVTSAPLLDAAVIQASLAQLNARLVADGAPYAIEQIELSLAPTADPANPNIVFAFDRALRLTSRWVPGDVRRGADGNNITFANFEPFMVANGVTPGEAAIDAAFATWNGVTCSKLPLVKRVLPPGIFPSVVFGLGGFTNDPFAADISNIGFLPGFLFDAFLGPGASTSVLGVTFTLIFLESIGGPPSDIDANHRFDTAIKEIWYNDNFLWSTNGGAGVDIETVALHEEGHGLEMGHFGRIAGNLKTGKLIVSPRAVMNAVILGTLRQPLGTDNSAYCGNWAQWPN